MASHSALQAAGTFVLSSRNVQKRVAIRTAVSTSPAVVRQHTKCTRTVLAAAGDDAPSAVADPAPLESSSASAASESRGGEAAPRSFSRTGGGRDGGRDGGGRGGRGGGRGRGRGPPKEPTVSNEQILPGAEFDGVVTSVQAYGAFVDFGARSNGLVHISHIADTFVERVGDVVTRGQEVHVRVLSTADDKISLSMKKPTGGGASSGDADGGDARPRLGKVAKRGGGSSTGSGNKRPGRPEPKVKAGESITGTVQRTTAYGAFLDLEDGTSALLHINSMSNPENLDSPQPRQLVKDGQKLQVRVLSVKDGKIDVTQQTEEEAKMDVELSKGVGTVAVGDDASPFAIMLARAGVQKDSFKSNDNGASSNQQPTEQSVDAVTERDSSVANKSQPAAATDQATSSAASQAPASSGATSSHWPKSGETEKPTAEAQLSAAGETAGAAAEVGVTAPAVAEEASAQSSAAKAESSTLPEQAEAEKPATETQQPGAAGAAAEAGVIAPAAAEEAVAAAPAMVSNAEAPKSEVSGLPSGVASSEATTPSEQLGNDAPATKTQLAAAGETPAAAEPQRDATPSDAEAHKKAEDGATHLQAAAAGEEIEKAPASEPPLTSQPASSPEEARVAGLEAAQEPELAAAAAPDSGASAGEGAEIGETGQPGDAAKAPAQGTAPQAIPASDTLAGEGASSEEEGKPGDVNETAAPSPVASTGGVAGAVKSAAKVVADIAPEPVATMARAAVGSAAADAAHKAADATPKAAAAAEPKAAPQGAAPASKPAGISAKVVKELRDKTGAGMMDCKKALTEASGDFKQALEALRVKGLAQAGKKADRIATEGLVATYIHAGAKLGVLVEVNCETDFVSRSPEFNELVSDIAMQVAASQEAGYVNTTDVPQSFVDAEMASELQKEDILQKPEGVRTMIVEGRVAKTVSRGALMEQPYIRDTNMLVSDLVTNAVAKLGENIKIRRFERFVLGEGIEKKEVDLAKEVEEQKAAVAAQAAAEAAAAAVAPAADDTAPTEEKPKIQIAASMVKELRQQSGAGMMDCKAALQEAGGNTTAAAEILRKKGLASAGKKAGRIASEGRVGSYIHIGSRLGSLIELNCETDFVARGDIFGELLSDLAMQVVSCPDVTVVSVDDVDKEVMEEERRIQLQKEDILQKPENIRERMVEGRLAKFAKEAALLEQPFIKDNNVTVGDAIKSAIAEIGENIKIRRFERFTLGEGLEKKNEDFAAEVAAQMGGQ